MTTWTCVEETEEGRAVYEGTYMGRRVTIFSVRGILAAFPSDDFENFPPRELLRAAMCSFRTERRALYVKEYGPL